jgi:VCBS repeat-containing protein
MTWGFYFGYNFWPRANDDFYNFSEDDSTTQSLNVLSNDTGLFKWLWSLNQDNPETWWKEYWLPTGGNSITLESGAQITITADGKIAYDFGAIGASIQSLGADDAFLDTFTYTAVINGTLKTATVNLVIQGENDVATIEGDIAGSVVEDGGSALSFAAAVEYQTGAYPSPHGLAVADVNGDGKTDVVTADHLGETVSLFLNDGLGDFSTLVTLEPGAAPDKAAVADVDGDGKADIVTADGPSNQISVLLNNGDGTFDPAALFLSGLGYTNAVALADMTGDGKLDAVCAGNDGVSLLVGNGDGTFGGPASIPHGVTRPASVVLADMNNDGKVDIVTAGIDSDNVAILYNLGGGAFGTPSTFAVGNGPQNVAVGYLNNDAFADIVVANTQADSISVLLGMGAGGFGLAQQYVVGSDVPLDVALGDFDGDGDDDIVTSNTSGNLSVLLNDGLGVFGSAQLFATGLGAVTPSVGAADFNGDGRLDIVASDIGNNRVWVLLNDGGTGGGGTSSTSGDLDVSDVDMGEDKFVVASPLEGVYGDFTFDADTGEWTYTLDNDRPATQALVSGQTEYDTLQVTSLDGTANATITVDVHGATDWIF